MVAKVVAQFIIRRWLAAAIPLLAACASVEPQRDRPADTAREPVPLEQWSGLVDTAGQDRLVPLNLGSHALQWRLRALRSATRSIDLQTFIWNDPWSLAIEDLTQGSGEQDFASMQLWLQENALEHHGLAESTPQDWAELLDSGFNADLELLVDTPADVDPALEVPAQLAAALISRIDAVQHDMILVSAYFIPTEALTDAIERATARGVRVRIFTNSLGSNNHVSAHAAYAAHRPTLLRAGAELYELRSDARSREVYLDQAVVQSLFGLHGKGALFDACCLFVGSANLDPRSLRLNTEVGLLIDSPQLNARVRELLAIDMLPENAWRVELDADGDIEWIGENGSQSHTPPASFYLRAESWFFGLLPIEEQM
jgi:putative cardiolipin synthase